MGTRCVVHSLAFALAAILVAPCVFAQESDLQKSAAEEFDRGRRLFQAKRFDEAALHFENAFRDAPKSAPLRSAARARLAAGDLARAATLVALAEERYNEEDGTRDLAKEVYPKVSAKLGRAVFSCEPACTATIDGQALGFSAERVATAWMLPGAHRVVLEWNDQRTVDHSFTISAGEKLTFSDRPPAPIVVAAPVNAPATAETKQAARGRKPLPPTVFWGGVAVTGVVGAIGIASGVSVLTTPGPSAIRRECAGYGTDCELYKSARAKQTRTNVLFAATGGAALVTAALGIFLVEWSPAKAEGRTILPTVGTDGTGATLGAVGRF